MDKLIAYIETTGQPRRAFAQRIGLTEMQLSRLLRGIQTLTAKQAAAIERATDGRVTLHDMVSP
jgi:DNA-binding transcriptional regulator YdaS (Cro superfamily)